MEKEFEITRPAMPGVRQWLGSLAERLIGAPKGFHGSRKPLDCIFQWRKMTPAAVSSKVIR